MSASVCALRSGRSVVVVSPVTVTVLCCFSSVNSNVIGVTLRPKDLTWVASLDPQMKRDFVVLVAKVVVSSVPWVIVIAYVVMVVVLQVVVSPP